MSNTQRIEVGDDWPGKLGDRLYLLWVVPLCLCLWVLSLAVNWPARRWR